MKSTLIILGIFFYYIIKTEIFGYPLTESDSPQNKTIFSYINNISDDRNNGSHSYIVSQSENSIKVPLNVKQTDNISHTSDVTGPHDIKRIHQKDTRYHENNKLIQPEFKLSQNELDVVKRKMIQFLLRKSNSNVYFDKNFDKSLLQKLITNKDIYDINNAVEYQNNSDTLLIPSSASHRLFYNRKLNNNGTKFIQEPIIVEDIQIINNNNQGYAVEEPDTINSETSNQYIYETKEPASRLFLKKFKAQQKANIKSSDLSRNSILAPIQAGLHLSTANDCSFCEKFHEISNNTKSINTKEEYKNSDVVNNIYVNHFQSIPTESSQFGKQSNFEQYQAIDYALKTLPKLEIPTTWTQNKIQAQESSNLNNIQLATMKPTPSVSIQKSIGQTVRVEVEKYIDRYIPVERIIEKVINKPYPVQIPVHVPVPIAYSIEKRIPIPYMIPVFVHSMKNEGYQNDVKQNLMNLKSTKQISDQNINKIILKDDYIGPVPQRDEESFWAQTQRHYRRSTNLGRNMRMEYGFKPPLIPSIEINENGLPIKDTNNKQE